MKTIPANSNANGRHGKAAGAASHALMLASMSALFLCGAQLDAQPGVQEFVSFHRFVDRTKTATADLARPGSRVKEAAAFEEMRQHILTMYRDVQVTHSFVLGSSHFDCIPVLQQPATRVAGLNSIAPEPPQSVLAHPAGTDDAAGRRGNLASLLDREKSADEFGNSLRCEEGTIPMRRLTLEQMTRFPTLRDYFQKGPDGAGRAHQLDPIAVPAADLSGHRYSRMYQTVDNLGGNSNLNIWRPYVDTTLGQEFSLSQEWYLGGSGDSFQSAEVGWQNYPKLYGDQNSRLFIYWTADNYQNTGCYNLDCGVFFQTNSDIRLGSDFGNAYSTAGGAQYEFSAQYYLYQGNWWLAIQGTWIGYYPGAIYRGGQLTKYAQQIQFGTESSGTTVWPGEGSGNWSTQGFGQAAYQRNLFYFNTQGSATWDTLTQWNSSPSCYNVSGPFSYNSPGWTVYFFEGGPGGSGC